MDTASVSKPVVDREKTAPFLIRMFIKIGGFHRIALFEDGTLPTTDEQQIFTWKDATLREVLTTLRITAPSSTEYRHPLAKYSFRALYADSANRGHFAQKELGMVYSRDILGEPGSLTAAAPRLLEDVDSGETRAEREERTLEELRFMPGDYLCVAVMLPKNVTLGGEVAIKGAAAVGTANGWKNGPSGFGAGSAAPAPGPPSALGRGGGHWRGGSDAPAGLAPGGRGRGGRGDPPRRDREIDRDIEPRDRDRDRRPPPPPPRRARDSPPHHRGGGGGFGRDRRSRSRSRSRTPPPPPRRRRYD